MAGFMIGLDATVVTTALPTIHADLHASVSTLGWTVSAYSLAFAALVLTGTALGDWFGRTANARSCWPGPPPARPASPCSP